MDFKSLSAREEAIAKEIVDSAYKVHQKLAPGLLEKVYEVCFCYELAKHGLKYQRQVNIPIVYNVPLIKKGIRRLFYYLCVLEPWWQCLKRY